MTEQHPGRGILERFAAHARNLPDRIAVSARDGELSYRDLDGRSTELAGRLVAAGAESGSVVALLAERTTHFVIGILGILKAGAAYLPIDPSHPGERTAELVRQAGCRLVVTQPELTGQAGEREDLQRLRAEPTVAGALDRVPVLPERAPASLAYVLPTSGSTGTPKGVQICDRNLLGLVEALRTEVYGELAEEPAGLRIGLVALGIFDASVQQIFLSLLLGHTLVIVPEQVRSDGALLRRFWAEQRIDLCDGTPAHLRMTGQLTSAPQIEVRRFLIGGDVLSTDVARRFLDQCAGQTSIVNVYGVAECAVDSIAGVFDPADDGDSVPIGRPLPGVEVALLDEDGRPVPDGEVGEIHLGGYGVGPGYLDRPELTAERFYADAEGGRWFRTGDLARRRPDGQLVFLGRADRQFKLRGQRIEPGEIESAIRDYAPRPRQDAQACQLCLLTDHYPKVTVTDGICSVCRSFAEYRDEVARYFGSTADLRAAIAERSTVDRSGYDVLLLFSGGKDSTYALYRLLDLGLKVLAFTFDNGYISPAAFENIRRITEHARVDLEIGTLPQMDEIFAESLRQDSTVCSGCFRGLTAMSTKLATDRGIGVVVTGLSRGQIYDTKLRRLVESGVREPAEIDQRLTVHRKVYHARQDRTAQLMALPIVEKQIEDILFLDYFRYDDATTAQIRQFLIERDSRWSAPADTGMCSTNCRINEVGIYVHSLERGYHNYASPLSWDCRLGVLDREQGLQELAAVAPRSHVVQILRKLGYTPQAPAEPITDAVVIPGTTPAGERQIWAYYVSRQPVDEQELASWLKDRLPSHMLPSRFCQLPELPVTSTGKIDLTALPEPGQPTGQADPPRSDTEQRLADIWQEVLGQDTIGRTDDFFAHGGDSLTATIVAGLVEGEFGISIPVAELFAGSTVAELAERIDAELGNAAGVTTEELPAPLALGPDGPGEPTFLFGDVWGNVEVYRSLADLLPGPSWALPGPAVPAGIRELGIDRICRIAADRVLDRQPDGPYRLLGWSFGAVIALGAARELVAAGHQVAELVAIDGSRCDPKYWQLEARRWRDYLEAGQAGPPPDELVRVMRPGTPRDRATLRSYAVAILPVLDALGEFDIEPVQLDRLRYVCPSQSALEEADLEWWRSATAGRFERLQVPGDHFSVLEWPLVRRLGEQLSPSLTGAARQH